MVRLSPATPRGAVDFLSVFDGAFISFVRPFVPGNNLEVNMKMIKSLILGSAAGLVAMSGAQAADLPVKAKAVEYVRICSLYGAGFYYIPGTDTCIKLGGYLRVETAFNASVFNGAYSGANGAQNRLSNYYTARSRQDLNFDTRTATEYGIVRTYADITFSWTSGRTPETRPSRAPPFTAAQRLLLTALTVVSLAARSASTKRSSSSLGSRWVRRIPVRYSVDQLSGQQLRRFRRRQRRRHLRQPADLHRSVR